MSEKPLLEWKFSRYLVLSSLILILPSIYGFYNGIYLFSGLIIISAIVSINYWINATFSLRRNLDLIFQKINIIVLIAVAFLTVESVPYILFTICSFIGSVICYLLSWRLWETKNKIWWKFHILFHLIITMELFVVLRSIILVNRNRKLNKNDEKDKAHEQNKEIIKKR